MKMNVLGSIGKQTGESVESVLKKEEEKRKKRLRWEGFVKKEGFKPGVKE